MALVKCPECGKDNSDTVGSCIHCGYVFNKIEKTKLNKKSIVPLVIILCVLFIAIGMFLFANRLTGLEKNAKKYVKELESMIGDIEVIDAVCFSYISYGEDEVSFKYLIEYTQNGKEDFALFIDDPDVGYAGNGYNGGASNNQMQVSFNNLNTLSAQIKYLEYLIGEGDQKIITEDDAKNNNEEGIIPLDVKRIK